MKLETVKAKLPKGIKRMIILKAAPQSPIGGTAERIVVQKKKKGKKKKQTKGLVRLWERLARRSSKANELSSQSYLRRHRSSNRKHRDGWLRDLPYNMGRARRKGNKELKLSKLFKW